MAAATGLLVNMHIASQPLQNPRRSEKMRPAMPNVDPNRQSLAFLRGFFQKPNQVASVVPSSRFVEQRIVDMAGIAKARVVVELGPGTGGTTRALLAALPRDARLLAIEINSRFVQLLRGSVEDERLLVHEGTAQELPDLVTKYGLPGVDAVVSGIPFSVIPPAVGREIISSVWSALSPTGCFLAYQIRSAVHDVAKPILGPAHDRELEVRNLPPTRIYCWWKNGQKNGHHGNGSVHARSNSHHLR